MTPANNDGQDFHIILYGYGTLSSFSNPKTATGHAAASIGRRSCVGWNGRLKEKEKSSFAGSDRAVSAFGPFSKTSSDTFCSIP